MDYFTRPLEHSGNTCQNVVSRLRFEQLDNGQIGKFCPANFSRLKENFHLESETRYWISSHRKSNQVIFKDDACAVKGNFQRRKTNNSQFLSLRNKDQAETR